MTEEGGGILFIQSLKKKKMMLENKETAKGMQEKSKSLFLYHI